MQVNLPDDKHMCEWTDWGDDLTPDGVVLTCVVVFGAVAELFLISDDELW